jgi:hypothetical protein
LGERQNKLFFPRSKFNHAAAIGFRGDKTMRHNAPKNQRTSEPLLSARILAQPLRALIFRIETGAGSGQENDVGTPNDVLNLFSAIRLV